MKPAELRRNKQQGSYDFGGVAEVFADSFLAHVSFVDEGLPQCLPMIALLAKLDGDEAAVYLHGHPSSRLMELVRAKERERGYLTGEVDKGVDDRFRVCITATKVDGLVLSSAPNGHSFNYRSAVIHGACSLVSALKTKRAVMRGVTNHIVAGRWEDVNPVASFQVALVCVIRVNILSLSRKQRTGVPGIQPRNVEKDGPSKEEPVWTGTVPLREVLETPVPSGLTDDAVVPKGLLDFVEGRNERHLKHAMSVAR